MSETSAALFSSRATARLQRLRRQRRRRHRLLLGRIVIWMTVLTLLAGGVLVCVVPIFFCCCEGRGDSARNQAYEIAKSSDIFKLQHGRWPTSLDELVHPPDPRKPIMEQLPLDPWGTPYAFIIPGLRNPWKFDVVSAGEDGLFFTDDDFGNWAR